MKQSRAALAPGVVVENVGDHTLVLVGNPPQVVRLSPEAAELLTLIQQNPGNEFEQTATLGELADLGVVEDSSPSALSRRDVMKLSAAAGTAGLFTLLLPSPAMASSSESPSFDAIGTYVFISSAWRFTLLRVDFPDETGGFNIGDLAIDGTTFENFAQYVGPPKRGEWADVDGGPYTGVVIGTLVGGTTGNSYTVGFTEEGSG